MVSKSIKFWMSGLTLALIAVGYGVREKTFLAPLVTGKLITPGGAEVGVGSHPINMAQSPDGKWLLVTDSGFREFLSVVDTSTGKVVSQLPFNGSRKAAQQIYYGVATVKHGDETLVAVSRGGEDKIDIYVLSDTGTLTLKKQLTEPTPKNSLNLPATVAGVVFSADGNQLIAVRNQSHKDNGFKGSISIHQVEGEDAPVIKPVGSFPLAIAAVGDHLFVGNEGGNTVSDVSLKGNRNTTELSTGTAPVGLKLNAAGTLLYVTNSSSDTLSTIDVASGKVLNTLLLRPATLRGLPGSTPLGMSLSKDEATLYVAMADLNAVAVVDTKINRLKGFLATGWYPTSVEVSKDGNRLFVASAKGNTVRNPNDKDYNGWGKYAPAILEGTVAMVDLSEALKRLPQSSRQVLVNNMAEKTPVASIQNPGIQHVVYIVKENRTYDQVLSDLPRGNGDTSQLMFGQQVTPNLHALCERFVTLDNFYVCAEVSADGWNWSTSGMTNAYTSRNVPVNYSGRGRNYDFEGTVNGSPVDLDDVRDVATAAGGYLWDAAAKAGVTYRNYGMFVSFADVAPNGNAAKEVEPADIATKKTLVDHTDLSFRRYDLAYADSDAWVKYGLAKAPRQTAKFGAHNAPSRISEWLTEFNEQVKKNEFPKLSMLRLGRDHTAGTGAGQYSPRAMVADNDYAVGQVVDAISHSPYWKSTIIFVLEDDAQAGNDHIDCHRSTAYVISPFIKKGTLDSRFFNTDSVLKTMGLLLGIKPWNQYVATAPTLDLFARTTVNDEPYTAILPSKEIIGEINKPTAYRSKDSDRLINPLQEETHADLELNDILWRSTRGKTGAARK